MNSAYMVVQLWLSVAIIFGALIRLVFLKIRKIRRDRVLNSSLTSSHLSAFNDGKKVPTVSSVPKKTKIPVLFLVALVGFSAASVVSPQKTFAWSGYPNHLPPAMPAISQPDSPTWNDALTAQLSSFNAGSSKYVSFGTTATNDLTSVKVTTVGSVDVMTYSMFICVNTADITFDKTLTGDYMFQSTSPFTCYTMYVYTYSGNNISGYDRSRVNITASSVTGAYDGTYYYFTSITSLGMTVNVKYSNDYDGQRGLASPIIDKSKSCDPLDFGCWIGNITGAVSGGLTAVAEQIIRGFTILFLPDGDAMSTKLQDFQTFMTTKLGFLAYPFTFLFNIFSSFTSSSSWCTSTSCTKDFGTLFGKNVTINLIQLKTTMPAVFDYSLAAIRGLLIFGLIYGLRRKYVEVMTK